MVLALTLEISFWGGDGGREISNNYLKYKSLPTMLKQSNIQVPFFKVYCIIERVIYFCF